MSEHRSSGNHHSNGNEYLVAHGADINAIDEEYQSTPLGYAAHWGKREVVALLLEGGADPNKSGAPWATPLAWARKKGRAEIESDLHGAASHPVRIAPLSQ